MWQTLWFLLYGISKKSFKTHHFGGHFLPDNDRAAHIFQARCTIRMLLNGQQQHNLCLFTYENSTKSSPNLATYVYERRNLKCELKCVCLTQHCTFCTNTSTFSLVGLVRGGRRSTIG